MLWLGAREGVRVGQEGGEGERPPPCPSIGRPRGHTGAFHGESGRNRRRCHGLPGVGLGERVMGVWVWVWVWGMGSGCGWEGEVGTGGPRPAASPVDEPWGEGGV